jgi:hypothetical protein
MNKIAKLLNAYIRNSHSIEVSSLWVIV